MREHLPPPGTPILRPVARIVAVAVGMTLLYAVLPLQEGNWWLDALVGLAMILTIVPLTVHRIGKLQTTERPWMVAVEALVLLFLMLIFGFSALYLTLDRNGTQFFGLDTRIDAVYFTVTTLSTVGFGDIHATGQAGRLAVSLQILVDFTLLAVSVRLLINATRNRVRPRQP